MKFSKEYHSDPADSHTDEQAGKGVGFSGKHASRQPEEKSCLYVSSTRMENDFFRIEFNDKGQFAHLCDKRAKREILKDGKPGNVIVSYEDRPHNYDAWDINNYYTEKSWEVDQLESLRVVETGPVRAQCGLSGSIWNPQLFSMSVSIAIWTGLISAMRLTGSSI